MNILQTIREKFGFISKITLEDEQGNIVTQDQLEQRREESLRDSIAKGKELLKATIDNFNAVDEEFDLKIQACEAVLQKGENADMSFNKQVLGEKREKLTVKFIEQVKELKDNIKKAKEELELEKGEGSRGGHVIGHTESGKPIYDKYSHKGHKNFTKQDHWDASDKHIQYMNMQNTSTSYGEKEKKQHDKERRKHEMAATYFDEPEKNPYHKELHKAFNWSEEKQIDILSKASEKKQAKVKKVMDEWKQGTLKTSAGEIVGADKQKVAIAIALSEAGLSKKKKDLKKAYDVFVYGTLKDGEARKAALGRDIPVKLAKVKGHVVDLKDNYKNYSPEGAKDIEGDVMSLTKKDIKKLDGWEDKYERKKVHTEDGKKAYVYEMKKAMGTGNTPGKETPEGKNGKATTIANAAHSSAIIAGRVNKGGENDLEKGGVGSGRKTWKIPSSEFLRNAGHILVKHGMLQGHLKAVNKEGEEMDIKTPNYNPHKTKSYSYHPDIDHVVAKTKEGGKYIDSLHTLRDVGKSETNDISKAEENYEGDYVGIIAQDNKNRVLLQKRLDNGQWMLPGGHIEKDELPIQAAKREFKEETNLDIALEDLYLREEKETSSGRKIFLFTAWGTNKEKAGQLANLEGDEYSTCKYMASDEWLAADLYKETKEHLMDILLPSAKINKGEGLEIELEKAIKENGIDTQVCEDVIEKAKEIIHTAEQLKAHAMGTSDTQLRKVVKDKNQPIHLRDVARKELGDRVKGDKKEKWSDIVDQIEKVAKKDKLQIRDIVAQLREDWDGKD